MYFVKVWDQAWNAQEEQQEMAQDKVGSEEIHPEADREQVLMKRMHFTYSTILTTNSRSGCVRAALPRPRPYPKHLRQEKAPYCCALLTSTIPESLVHLVVLVFSAQEDSNQELEDESLDGHRGHHSEDGVADIPSFQVIEELESANHANNC